MSASYCRIVQFYSENAPGALSAVRCMGGWQCVVWGAGSELYGRLAVICLVGREGQRGKQRRVLYLKLPVAVDCIGGRQ